MGNVKNCPSSSTSETCTEFEVRTDWNFHIVVRQTYVALKLQFVASRGNEFFKTKQAEPEHKYESKAAAVNKEMEAVLSNFLVTHVNNPFHSFFCNFEAYVNNQHLYAVNGE